MYLYVMRRAGGQRVQGARHTDRLADQLFFRLLGLISSYVVTFNIKNDDLTWGLWWQNVHLLYFTVGNVIRKTNAPRY